MKKKISMSISILLSCLITSGLFLPVFAASKKTVGIPVIDVDGIFSDTLYLNPGKVNETAILPPSTDMIFSTVGNLTIPKNIAADNLWQETGNILFPNLKAILEPLSCNADGTSKYDVGIKKNWSLPKNYNFDSVLEFAYDWRMDYMDAAKSLNEYIHYLQEQTGCEKVALIPNSMGGIVTTAYLQQFGSADIDAIVMRSSAFQGVSLVGELFTKKIEFNKNTILGYINDYLTGDSQSNEISVLLSVLNTIGVFDMAVPATNEFFYQLKDRLYDEVLKDIFGTMPGMWELIPDEYYDAAKATMLDPVKNAELIKKIDYYHYNVQNKVKEILQNAMNKGVKLAIISNYNLQGVPVTTNTNVQTDSLIDTVYTSGGATCAPLGSTFCADYIQAVNCGHNHISPDNIIDASTCMFPECTWFVKGMIHTNFNSDYDALVNWILNSDGQQNVFSNAVYPQFLQLNKAENTLSPVESTSAKAVLQSQLMVSSYPAKKDEPASVLNSEAVTEVQTEDQTTRQPAEPETTAVNDGQNDAASAENAVAYAGNPNTGITGNLSIISFAGLVLCGCFVFILRKNPSKSAD